MSSSSSHTIESIAVEIAAPAPFVWDLLVDYPSYPLWNPYTVAVQTTLAVGDPIELTLPNPDGSGGTFVNREYIRVVDPPRQLRYDTGNELPGIFGRRDQYVERLGPDRCGYRTTEVFSGEYAEQIFASHGPWVKAGFDAVARALKAHAETRWAARTA
ncbi:SRPBCC domain-containing protein [Amycolatopsis nigrescens]|uniref:SRPBCC domain-containing protein n=1 Tax=Amycolatopsis nigrescens TaxID=381445 RepID=UPI00035C2C5F|nr:SRPBCC domain-containing protein [Amycolatopsis nigrescens]